MVNDVILIGNLGKDPELRATQSGASVCSLSVATTRRYKNAREEWIDETEWHRVVVWGKTAEACGKHLEKGRQVYVRGRIATRTWDDRDGNKRSTTEIIAEDVRFLGGGGSSSGGGGRQTSGGGAKAGGGRTQAPRHPEPDPDDDIPF